MKFTAFISFTLLIVIINLNVCCSNDATETVIKSLSQFIEPETTNAKEELQSTVICGACRSLFYTLKNYLNSEIALKLGTIAVCNTLKLAKSENCVGYARLFTPHLSYILKNSNLTADQMCGVIIGKKCLSNPPSIYETWLIDLPKPKQNRPTFKENMNNLRILHLSDFHFDPLYSPGSLTNCDESLCCRAISVNGNGSAGYWGHAKNCDAPLHLLKSLVYHLNESHASDFDLLFWTGDNNPHDDWMTTTDSIVFTSTTISNLFNKYLSKGKAIFPILGNHEGMPANQFALTKEKKFDTQWLYDKLAEHWSQWLNTPDSKRTFKIGGYYAKKYGKQFKIIALNTNLCTLVNLWTLYNPIDPGNQLQWLVNELKQSEDNGEYVYILGHVAPDWQCSEIWFHNYMRITERFRETIKGFFFGHTHRDEIKLYFSPKDQNEVMHVGYIGPSVTTFNPGYRFYSLNKDGSVENIHSYYLNLTEANMAGKSAKLNWRKLYEAKSDYELKSLSISEWYSFYKRLQMNDTLTQIYYKNTIRLSDAFASVCDDKCKNSLFKNIAQRDQFDL